MRPYLDLLRRANDNIQSSLASSELKKASEKALRLVKVEISGRLTTTAGIAKADRIGGQHLGNFRIILSRDIFSRISDEEKFNTVSHEFAHIVDYVLHDRSNKHNSVWKFIHSCCGGTGKRTHNYNVVRRKVKRYIIYCVNDPSKEYKLTKRRYDSIMRSAFNRTIYRLVRIEIYQGRTLVESHKIA